MTNGPELEKAEPSRQVFGVPCTMKVQDILIKDLIIFSPQTPGLRKRPRFEDIKKEKFSIKMNFFCKKTVIFIIRDLFCL